MCCFILLNDIMDVHMLSLTTLIPLSFSPRYALNLYWFFVHFTPQNWIFLVNPLRVTKFLVEISQFKFLIVTEKHVC